MSYRETFSLNILFDIQNLNHFNSTMSDAPVAPKKVKVVADHPKYNEMIVAAVTELKSRKGTSKQAIVKYITSSYKVGDSATTHIKLALKRMVAGGKLSQVSGVGASGSFKLVKAEPVKKAALKKSSVKKVALKKSVVKKPAAKKAAPKKAVAKKPVAKKASPKKKAPVKKVALKKKVAAKKPAKKTATATPVKKTKAKKVAVKKASPKKKVVKSKK